MLAAGWALAAPYDAGPDEYQHLVRAVGAARGEIAPEPTAAANGTGAFQHVPAGLVRDNCWAFRAGVSADCAKAPGGDDHLVEVGTRAGRYNPLYYVLVGGPAALWPSWSGVLLSRLVSCALSAAFLAAAATACVRWSRHRLMAAGVLVAATPMVLHLSAALNPNGLEIAASLALFTALVPAALGAEKLPGRAWAVQVGLAGATLVTLRSLGPLWAAAAVGVLFVPPVRGRLRALWNSRGLRVAALVTLLAAAAGALWTVGMRAAELSPVAQPVHLTLVQALRFEAVARLPEYLNQMIGKPSWLDTEMPGTVYVLWELTLGALVLPALAFGRWADRWRLAAIALGGVAVAIVPDALSVNSYGFATQGRYVLPLLVALPVLAAWLLGERGVLDPARGNQLTRLTALIVLPLQLVVLGFTMIRWQRGLTWSTGADLPNSPPNRLALNPLTGSWHPVVGSATALLAAVAGAALLLAWVWAHTRRPEEQPPRTA
nr:DUF2142 domain-containing protein [Kitasatospora sp. SID7827]